MMTIPGFMTLARPRALQAHAREKRERVARAIWNLRREHEDRCDMELEDMGADHPVWAEADAAIAAMAAKVSA